MLVGSGRLLNGSQVDGRADFTESWLRGGGGGISRLWKVGPDMCSLFSRIKIGKIIEIGTLYVFQGSISFV